MRYTNPPLLYHVELSVLSFYLKHFTVHIEHGRKTAIANESCSFSVVVAAAAVVVVLTADMLLVNKIA